MRNYTIGLTSLLLLATATLRLGEGTADAALTVYTDRSAWETAIGSFATDTFEATALGSLNSGVNVYSFFTATIDANDSGFTTILEPGAVNSSREFRARIGTDFPNDPSSIVVDLFGPVLGIGADFVGTTDGDLLTLTVGSDTVEFDQHLAGSGDGFLGVISNAPFNMLTLGTEIPSLSGEAFALDNVSFGPIVPEPSTYALAVLGLLALGFYGWRRRKTRDRNRPETTHNIETHLRPQANFVGRVSFVAAFLMALFAVQPLRAALLIPSGLDPGEKYHLMFASSTKTTATAIASDIALADAFVQSAADAAGIGITEGVQWTAVVSYTGIDAHARFAASAPIFNMVGQKVADDESDLFDGSFNLTTTFPIRYTEFGTDQISPTGAYTGFNEFGMEFVGFTIDSADVLAGVPAANDHKWARNVITSFPHLNTWGLYAISEELTVPGLVPEPSTYALAAIGLLGLCLYGWRRKRA